MATTDPDRARLLRGLVSDPNPEAAKFGREQLAAELAHQREVEKGLLVTEQRTLIGVAILLTVVIVASLLLAVFSDATGAAVIALSVEVVAALGALAARSYWGAKQSSQASVTKAPEATQLEG